MSSAPIAIGTFGKEVRSGVPGVIAMYIDSASTGWITSDQDPSLVTCATRMRVRMMP